MKFCEFPEHRIPFSGCGMYYYMTEVPPTSHCKISEKESLNDWKKFLEIGCVNSIHVSLNINQKYTGKISQLIQYLAFVYKTADTSRKQAIVSYLSTSFRYLFVLTLVEVLSTQLKYK